MSPRRHLVRSRTLGLAFVGAALAVSLPAIDASATAAPAVAAGMSTVSGRIVTPLGLPVADASVTLYVLRDFDGQPGYDDYIPGESLWSESDGSFEFAAPSGTFSTVMVTKHTYFQTALGGAHEVLEGNRFPVEGTVNVGDLVLEPATPVTGTATGPAGELANVAVDLYRWDPFPRPSGSDTGEFVTDNYGNYSFGSGRYVVYPSRPGHYAMRFSGDIHLRLMPGWMGGQQPEELGEPGVFEVTGDEPAVVIDLPLIYWPFNPPELDTPATVGGYREVGRLMWLNATDWNDILSGLDIQWLRDGLEIPGATGAHYRSVPADLGHRISIRLVPYSQFGDPGLEHTSSVVVIRHATRTGLMLDRAAIGKRQRARATVGVSVPTGAVPTGTMTITAGRRVVATSRLAGTDKGLIEIRLPRLRPGRYVLRARYSGSAVVAPSISAPLTLRVRTSR